MIHPSIMWAVAKADFRERSRGYVYLVTITAALYFGYLFIPPVGETFYYTLTLGKFRGFYNAAWVGTAAAMAGVSLMMLAGFYLIKNAVGRDERYRVGELLAASPISKFDYIAGKFCSNLGYLGSVVVALVMMSFVMLLLRGEDPNLQVFELIQPFLLITVPAVVFLSACAVFFEVTPGIRGGIGNILYYFLIVGTLPLFIETESGLDMMGIEIVEKQTKAAIASAVPEYTGGFSLGHMGRPMPEGAFYWDGIDWTSAMVADRSFWLGLALVLLAFSIPIFSRFDPSLRSREKIGDGNSRVSAFTTAVRSGINLALVPLFSVLELFRIGRMVIAEVRIALVGLPSIWYLVSAGLWLATLLSPLEIARQYLMPFAWIWPILIWSQLGVREQRHRVDQIMYSMPNPGLWQPLAAWFAGLGVALLTGSGMLIRGVVHAEWGLVGALLAGALFIPSLALASGVITKSSRMFEILYLMLWYVGPMNRAFELDYIGTYPQTIGIGMPPIYLALAIGLLIIALFVRSRQVRN